jgi:tetratricopeptide (TPR) repeat protein
MIERDLSQADAMLMEARALAQRRRVNHHALPTALGVLRYHENELDEAEELFKEARTLCRLAGDRIDEYEAIAYRVMIELERGRFDRAAAHCKELLELGENMREGSERPFARALSALCEYALSGDAAGLGPALDELRTADAKHRMAYTLIRAALLDLEGNELDSAIARATEALEYARLLERASEVMMAHVVLASACQASGNAKDLEIHVGALRELSSMPVAVWARNRAGRLLKAIGHD